MQPLWMMISYYPVYICQKLKKSTHEYISK
jgi:hypothetical protein